MSIELDHKKLKTRVVSCKQAKMISNLKKMGLLEPPSTKLAYGSDIIKRRNDNSHSSAYMINHP